MFHFFSVSRKGTGVLQQWEEQEVESLPSILLQYVAKGEVGLVEGSAVTSGPTKCLRKPAARSAAGAERRENLSVCRFTNICLSRRRCVNMDFLERTVMFQWGLYRNVAKFGFTAYHSGPCPFSVSLRMQVLFFPTDLFFFPSFTSVRLDLFCFRLIWLVVMTASLCQVLIWSESENQTFCLPATL